MTEGPRFYGKHRATVINNVDPMLQGRIMFQLSDRFGLFPSSWAMPCVPFASLGMGGMVALPPAGATVWIEFEAGDPEYPIWTGGYWPTSGGFPALALAGATPANPNIHMQTTLGTTITLSDNPAQQVLIVTPTLASVTIGAAGVMIQNGQGASILMSGPSVIINNGALVVT